MGPNGSYPSDEPEVNDVIGSGGANAAGAVVGMSTVGGNGAVESATGEGFLSDVGTTMGFDCGGEG